MYQNGPHWSIFKIYFPRQLLFIEHTAFYFASRIFVCFLVDFYDALRCFSQLARVPWGPIAWFRFHLYAVSMYVRQSDTDRFTCFCFTTTCVLWGKCTDQALQARAVWFHSAAFANRRNKSSSPSRSCALPPAGPAFPPCRSMKRMLTAVPRHTRPWREGVCLSVKLSLKRMSSLRTTFHSKIAASPPYRKRPILLASSGDGSPQGGLVHWNLGSHCMGLRSRLPPSIKADSIREQVISNGGRVGTHSSYSILFMCKIVELWRRLSDI